MFTGACCVLLVKRFLQQEDSIFLEQIAGSSRVHRPQRCCVSTCGDASYRLTGQISGPERRIHTKKTNIRCGGYVTSGTDDVYGGAHLACSRGPFTLTPNNPDFADNRQEPCSDSEVCFIADVFFLLMLTVLLLFLFLTPPQIKAALIWELLRLGLL
ncbi:hypothetical protein INR49_018441 [Caranx melampygus]|nr:hypothetical protein INR49_018441 [Caranx melampygus]